MTTIAVAGGTHGIGRAIAEFIKHRGKHNVKILSRNSNDALAMEIGCKIIAVDYDDVEALTRVLEDNKIDTVISTMLLVGTGKPQNNLVIASEASRITRRFIPSIWGIPYTEEELSVFELGRPKFEVLDYLKKSNLEYTSFYTGYFLDYWGYPRVLTYQDPSYIVVDIENNVAAIPGKGETLVTFIHTTNIAEFVAASLDLPKWETESYIVGDKVTWNEFVKIAEEVKGTKFSVTYDSSEDLRSGKVTELPSHPRQYTAQLPKEIVQNIFSVFGTWFEKGLFDLRPQKTLNEVFPDIKIWSVREVLERAWKHN